MSRLILALGLAAACAFASEKQPQGPAFLATEVLLEGAYGERAPISAVYETETRCIAVALQFEFRHGLFRLSDRGRLLPEQGGILLEYASADAPEDPFANPYRPALFQPEENPDWIDRLGRAEPVAGQWLTEDASTEPIDRVIRFYFERPGRYRLRITGLRGDTIRARRAPTIVGIQELEADEDGEDGFDSSRPEAPAPPVPPAPPVEIVVAPPAIACPFCGHAMTCVIRREGRPVYYSCRHCSGTVHVDRNGSRRASVRIDGRRRSYDFVRGRAVGWSGRRDREDRFRDRHRGPDRHRTRVAPRVTPPVRRKPSAPAPAVAPRLRPRLQPRPRPRRPTLPSRRSVWKRIWTRPAPAPPSAKQPRKPAVRSRIPTPRPRIRTRTPTPAPPSRARIRHPAPRRTAAKSWREIWKKPSK